MTNADDTIRRCLHCGAEPLDDDEQCRFCGEIMSPVPGKALGAAHALAAGLGGLKAKVRPMTAEEHQVLFEETTFNLSNPADPIWDE